MAKETADSTVVKDGNTIKSTIGFIRTTQEDDYLVEMKMMGKIILVKLMVIFVLKSTILSLRIVALWILLTMWWWLPTMPLRMLRRKGKRQRKSDKQNLNLKNEQLPEAIKISEIDILLLKNESMSYNQIMEWSRISPLL